MAASVYFNRDASQGSTYFVEKYYSGELSKYENTTLQTISRGVRISLSKY